MYLYRVTAVLDLVTVKQTCRVQEYRKSIQKKLFHLIFICSCLLNVEFQRYHRHLDEGLCQNQAKRALVQLHRLVLNLFLNTTTKVRNLLFS